MARLVKTTAYSDIICNIVTNYENGSSTTRQVKADDLIEDTPLRYVYKQETKSITGIVQSVSTVCNKISAIDMKYPTDHFLDDFSIKDLRIDASEKYHSNIVTVDCKEIVEDAGATDVKSVKTYPHPVVYLDLVYTDDTIVHQVIEIGDVLDYVKIMQGPGKPDISGSYKVAAFGYTRNGNRPKFDSLVLTPYERTGKNIRAYFENIISFEEVPSTEVTDTTSLASIATLLAESENGKASATLGVDVEIPKREDGKITTLMIGEGKELDLDLNGHSINCEAYAFYVNGGTLNIYDDTNSGKIECTRANAAYPAVFVGSNGVCNMYGGTIDTTNVVLENPEDYNWLYGVVCSGNGIFNMEGGTMTIGSASGIAITNGTATGEGAQFTIGGDSVITSIGCAAIYLADNKSLTIKDNATINGGIVLRMGDLSVEDKAVINSHKFGEDEPLGEQVVYNGGVMSPKAAILALTGVYGSALGNDMNINIASTAKLNGYIDNGIDIAEVNTKYDQIVNVSIDNLNSITSVANKYYVYNHDELAELASAAGKVLPSETNTTTLTINVEGEQVYPEPEPAPNEDEDNVDGE